MSRASKPYAASCALVREHLKHRDGGVRAAAVVALPRLGDPDSVEALCAALEDSQRLVRDNATLALGATGTPAADHVLLRLAHHGALEGEDSVSQWARPLAVTALALARHRGSASGSERMLPSGGTENERLADAVLMHPFLAPTPGLAPLARDASALFGDDEDAEPVLRGIEALRFGADRLAFARVLRAVGHRDLQVRRSAALTLGEMNEPRALEPLMSAFELEREHLTRGFLLLAIGRLGGESARDFLQHALRTGSSTVRPWGALALGILAEEEDDDVARAGLREAFLRERNRDARGAYYVALGIARDRLALPILRSEMADSGNALDRSLAALALSISAPNVAADDLRKALSRERSPLTRAAMAQALGSVGDVGDAQALVDLLRSASDPTIQVQLAAAVGVHGTEEAVLEVVRLLKEPRLSNHGRAAALQCLGMLLDDELPFRFAALARATNFTELPPWIDVALQSTL